MKSASECTLRNERNAAADPPETGIGRGRIPEARRKRTGGLSITRAEDVDFDGPPFLVAEIEVEPALQPANTDMDDTFGGIEPSARLEHASCGLQSFAAGCAADSAARDLVIATAQASEGK
jgi:hypothetical protein